MSKKYSAELIQRLIKQISGKIESTDGELLPEYRIKGRGNIWCYSPADKNIVQVPRGISVYLVEDSGDRAPVDNKCLIYSQMGGLYMIDCDEIEELGFD
jgi:hypothetical protein